MNNVERLIVVASGVLVLAYFGLFIAVVTPAITATMNTMALYVKNDYRASTSVTEPILIGDTIPPCNVSGLEYIAGWCHE